MDNPADNSVSILMVSVALIVFVGLGFFAVMWVRKRMSPHEDMHGEGFTLTDLRELHRSGKISDEEFERAKAKMVEALHAQHAARAADTTPPRA